MTLHLWRTWSTRRRPPLRSKTKSRRQRKRPQRSTRSEFLPSLSINQEISPGKGAVQILSSEGLRPLLHPQRSEQDQPHVPVLPQGVQRRVRRRHQGVWRSHNQLKILSNLLSVLSWTQTWPTELETSQTPSLSKCSSTQQGGGSYIQR